MNARILRGTKQEIAESVARIDRRIREGVAFVEAGPRATAEPAEYIFTEMEPFETTAGGADYSREALYSRVEGE